MVKWKLVTLLFVIVLLFFIYYQQPIKSIKIKSFRTIFVFIHIQKTAGSEFERSIVRRLKFDSSPSCRCPNSTRFHRTKRVNVKLRCDCTRNDDQPWLISRFSTGWLCGVHADWTSYHRCLPSKLDQVYRVERREFVYGTLLREPVARFISEYLHTLRGANWFSERFPCVQSQQRRNQFACWNKTNLIDFIQCPFNSAVNRETRMLSSPKSDCSVNFHYENLVDLRRAKSNLESMEFFGLTEHLSLSQRLFETTKFCRSAGHRCSFQSYLDQNPKNDQTNDFLQNNLTSGDLQRLRQLNSDDLQLYEFARNLFFQRTCRMLGVACA